MFRTLQNLFPRNRRTLVGLNLILIFGILVACLWPFRAPKNTAIWVAGGQGIDLGHYGVLLADKALTMPGDPGRASVTLELWLQPHPKYVYGEMLAIYTAQNARQFDIGQWHSGLTVRSANPGDPTRNGGAPCYTPDLFVHGKDVFITITSDATGTSVYAGGVLQKVKSDFRITNRMLSGGLVFGTGASGADTWRGQIHGFAIYNRALSPDQVRLDDTSWIEKGRPFEDYSKDLLTAYLFNEREGRTIHNIVKDGGGLTMPETFIVPEKVVLERPALDDWTDIIENIIGFMPLGFVMCGYLMLSRRGFAALAMTAIICGVFSLGLETLQIWLPTRDSSLMDVISNFTGGTLGALIYVLFTWIFPAFQSTSME